MDDTVVFTRPVATVDEVQQGWHELKLRISQLEAERAALEHDNKTLRSLLERVIEHRQKSHSELVLLLMDLDHFKKINDQHGHAAGDAVLVQFADRLREVFRGSDIVVRWGGEEFLALARGSPRDRAGELAGRVLEAVRSRPFQLRENKTLRVTVSIGFVVFPLDPMAPRAWDWDATLHLADGALYAAKAQGRDGFIGACQADGLPPDEAPDSLRAWLGEPRLTVERSRGATLQ